MSEQEKITRDILEAMTPRERGSYEFLERVAIIEEACRVKPVEAYMIARRQGQR